MKKISFWAKDHVWQSRLIIVLIYILLNIIGISTGKLLKEINVVLPEIYFTTCAVLIIALWIFYPDKKKLKSLLPPAAAYFRRKLFDVSLVATTFLVIVYAGNNWQNLFFKSESAQAIKVVRITKDSSLYNNPLIKNFLATIKNTDVSKLSAKQKIRMIKHQIRDIKHSKETSKSDKTLLIILSVLIAIGLIMGLGALSCSIACGGSEGLAYVLFFGGTFLVIFLLVRFIKHLSKKPEVKANE